MCFDLFIKSSRLYESKSTSAPFIPILTQPRCVTCLALSSLAAPNYRAQSGSVGLGGGAARRSSRAHQLSCGASRPRFAPETPGPLYGYVVLQGLFFFSFTRDEWIVPLPYLHS